MLTSTRRGIVYPNTTRSDSADVPRDFAALVAALEADVVWAGQGTLAARPTSTAGSPGMQGRVYFATDQSPMTLWYDYGTGWQQIGALAAGAVGTTQLADGSVTTVKLADANVTTAKIADGAVTLTKIPDNTITAAKLNAALFPSGGAGAGTEALRAIGAGAGNVIAGNDTRVTSWVVAGGAISVTNLAISSVGAAAANTTFQTWVTGDTNVRLVVRADGLFSWGPGNAGADIVLYRSAAATLRTDGTLVAVGGAPGGNGFFFNPATAAGNALISQVGSEVNSRFLIESIGILHWGAGGASTLDTNLYRDTAAQIATDGGFILKPSGTGIAFTELRPAATPSASATAHAGRLQVVVNGGGKGELRCYWPGGGFTLITTEP